MWGLCGGPANAERLPAGPGYILYIISIFHSMGGFPGQPLDSTLNPEPQKPECDAKGRDRARDLAPRQRQ